MAPKASALSPIDPSTIPDAEKENDAPWIVRKLVGSVPGRIALSSYESLRATGTSMACLSPWGDSSLMILPCIRMRDVAVHALVASTGGVASVATPVLHVIGDTIIQAGLDTIVVEVGVVAAYDLGSQAANSLLVDKLFDQVPKTSARLKTTAVKSILITLKHKRTMNDAALGFYRSSMHPDSSLFSDVADYLSIQKGWFSPYLFATNRRPIIPRAMRPDVVFCHGPFLSGDYRVAETLLAESASVISLCDAPPPAPPIPEKSMSFLGLPTKSRENSLSLARSPSPAPTDVPVSITDPPPRGLLICLLGLKPHRAGLWAFSARPEESIFHYLLLNGCPCIVLPAAPGCPLIAWDTLTLADLYKKADGGGVDLQPQKWQSIVKILFEYVCLCLDWDRVRVPSEGRQTVEPDQAMKEKAVFEAIDLLVEGAMRSVEYKDVKKNIDIDRAGFVMFRMP